ncbi:MAG TPA: VOC family protein [Nocardioides sp.]|nr:VOC family protein [Nocardioides sp.]
MHLENVVFDAVDPGALGRFWESRLGTETLTDAPEGFETRLAIPGWPFLDLCFQRVPELPTAPQRLRLDLREEEAGDDDPLADLLADPEGNAFGVLGGAASYDDTGPLAALVLESADPSRDLDFWAWLTGWAPAGRSGAVLRHPSRHGPVLGLVPEQAPKGSEKNRIHLDVRLAAEDDADAVREAIADLGGRELHLGYGDLPWRHYADPSGNELCVLRAPA